jgi:hypothetical protein
MANIDEAKRNNSWMGDADMTESQDATPMKLRKRLPELRKTLSLKSKTPKRNG